MILPLIWLVGYIAFYFVAKNIVASNSHQWTVQDRAITLTVSVTSFAGLLLLALCYVWDNVLSDNKANW